MAQEKWTLFDQDQGEHVGHEFDVHRDSADGVNEFRIQLQLGQAGLSRGVEQVVLSNGAMRIVVLPTRGMSIWKVWVGDPQEPLGWGSPVRGPVHPSFVPLTEASGLGWLDGFDELLVRCGLESNGAPEFDERGALKYPLHGRIGNRPAYKLEAAYDREQNELRLTGWVEETRFHFLKLRLTSTLRTRLGSNSIDIVDTITNLSASPAEAQMLYHVNFGHPLLDAGSQVIGPFEQVVPRNDHAAKGISTWNSYAAETQGYEEQVYFATMQSAADKHTRVVLKNAHATRGVALRFNTQQLPCFTLWKNTTASEDGFVTGMEPGTNYPNPRSFEGQHGRTRKLSGHESVTLELGLDYLPTPELVEQHSQMINQIRRVPPQVHLAPLPKWCAT